MRVWSSGFRVKAQIPRGQHLVERLEAPKEPFLVDKPLEVGRWSILDVGLLRAGLVTYLGKISEIRDPMPQFV